MDYFLAACLSFLVTFISLPVVINVFNSINLLDIPDRRKIHKISTPSLGGIPIIVSLYLTILIILPFQELASMKFFMAAVALIFLLGIRDDIASLDARQKLVIQLLAAFMVVQYSDVRILSFHGFLGIDQLNTLSSKAFTIFLIVALTNSFNLIDGIDGLAGAIGLIALVFMGTYFFLKGENSLAVIAICLASGLLAFLYFNWYPSRIFMGDTGSMSLGFVIAVLIIIYTKMNVSPGINNVDSPIALSIALMIVPVYDTLRVMTKRIIAGKSPFRADRNHTHHVLLRIGFNHSQSAMILVGFTLIVIFLSLWLHQAGDNLLVMGQLATVFSFGAVLDFIEFKRRKNANDGRSLPGRYFISKSA